MPFREPRHNLLDSRQQTLVAAASCLMISALAAGAVSQSPSQKANSDTTGSPAVKDRMHEPPEPAGREVSSVGAGEEQSYGTPAPSSGGIHPGGGSFRSLPGRVRLRVAISTGDGCGRREQD
jgi:hypothetical protein